MRLRNFIGFLLIVGLLTVTASGFADEPVAKFVKKILPFEKLEMAGYFANETGLSTAGFDKFMKVKNIVDLKGNYKFSDSIEFFMNTRYWYDFAYSIEEDYDRISSGDKNIQLRRVSKLDDWLRDCYLDIYTPRLDMRFGRQQVVWGTTDGVRILDMVNPLDYREWTLKDFSDIRMPLWMANFEGALMANGHLQLLVIPDYEPNYYAPAGSPFALRTVIIGEEAAQRVTVQTIDELPERTPENTKIGVRWRSVVENGMFSGLDYTLNYLHTYDFASSAYTFFQFGFPPVLRLTRRAEQIEVFGGSFSKSITKGLFGNFAKGWTLRGEFAYVANGAMNYGTDKNINGTVDVDQYNYAFGFDKNFLTNWQFSAQFIQLIAVAREEYDKGKYTLLFGPTRGPLDPMESLITLKIATDFAHERVKPEILFIYGDDCDWRISPKVVFELNDNWMLTTGLHIFEGRATQLNGQFDKADEFYLETKYSW